MRCRAAKAGTLAFGSSCDTLADVRELLKHLPKGHRERSTWQHVAKQLAAAAHDGDINDVVAPLQMVLSMEGVPYQLK